MRVEDHVYLRSGDVELQARVYTPDGPGPFPCLLDVHGGAWVGGSRTSNETLNTALAEAGYLVAALEFRLPPAHPYPAASQDIHAAARWLKTHARELGGRPERIGVVAVSSGAQSSGVVGLRPFDPEIGSWSTQDLGEAGATLACFVACWGILDPSARYAYAKSTGRAKLVANHEAMFVPIERMDEGNPRLIVERGDAQLLPPVLILQGSADANIPVALQERFRETYLATGGVCDLAVFDGLPHGFGNDGADGTRQAVSRMLPFLEQHLGSVPASTPSPGRGLGSRVTPGLHG